MKKKRIITCILVGTMLTGLLTACGDSSDDESALFGQVQSISQDSIVVLVGNNKSGKDGQKPAKPASGGAFSKDGERPSRPASGGAFEMPKDSDGKQMTPPDGVSDYPKGGMLEFSGETKTIAVDGDTKVEKRSGDETVEGSLTDISIGSIVTVKFQSDGKTADVIEVRLSAGNNPSRSKHV